MSNNLSDPFIVWEGSVHEPMLQRNTLVRVVVEYKPAKKGKFQAHFIYEWAAGLDAMGDKNWIELPEHDRNKLLPSLVSDLIGIPLVKMNS